MITIDDVKNRFLSDDLEAITGGDDSVITRALDSAKLWMKTFLGTSYDEDNEIHAEITIKRAVYELYAYSQDWEVAKANKGESEEMLKTLLGIGEDKSLPPKPYAVSVQGDTTWHGFE